MRRLTLGHLSYILGSLSGWGQLGMAPPARLQVFARRCCYRTLKSGARSRISAADVADATAAAARSAAAATDARNGSASAAGSTTARGTARDAATATAGSATTGGATGNGAASAVGSATAGPWCGGWRGRHAGGRRSGGRWRCATAWPFIAAAASDR